MHPNQNPVPPTVPQNQNQNQYQQYQQQHQQMLQQQQVPPGLGPQQAQGHPHTQVTVPPVVPPAPLGRHGTATPEQILAEASNTQLGAGLNPQPQHPQVSYTPAVGGNPQLQVQQQQQMPPQIPQQQQQQQIPPQVPELSVNTSDFPQVPEQVLEDLVGQAQEGGIPQSQVNQYVAGELQKVGRMGSYDKYQEYQGKFDQFVGALTNQYGEQGAEEQLALVKDNILRHGGQPLLNKFHSDPGMLAPEVITPYLKDPKEPVNPYEQYMQGPGNPGMSGQMGGGGPQAQAHQQTIVQDPSVIQSRIKEMYNAPMAQKRTDSWNQEMLNLNSQMAQVRRAQQMGGMAFGG